jgi:hypothetical protein
MNLTELEEMIALGPEVTGVVNLGLLKVLAFMMREDPDGFPTVKDAVLGRLESEAEIYLTMGMLTGNVDREEFRSWATLAAGLGVTLEEAKVATDRGADKAQKGVMGGYGSGGA